MKFSLEGTKPAQWGLRFWLPPLATWPWARHPPLRVPGAICETRKMPSWLCSKNQRRRVRLIKRLAKCNHYLTESMLSRSWRQTNRKFPNTGLKQASLLVSIHWRQAIGELLRRFLRQATFCPCRKALSYCCSNTGMIQTKSNLTIQPSRQQRPLAQTCDELWNLTGWAPDWTRRGGTVTP